MLDKTEDSKRRLSDLDKRLTYRLSRLQARLNKHAAIVLARHSALSLTQWRLLASIEALGTTTLAELVREMQYDKAQLSRGISSLEQKGMVSLTPDPADHRRHLISLTDAGEAEHDRILPAVRERQRMLQSRMTEAEVAGLFSALAKVEAALDEEGA